MSNRSTEAVFDALGEPVRRRIVEVLTAGPLPVGELAEQLPVGRPAVSKHLRCLSDAGLVEHSRAGTRNLYALAPAGFTAAQQWLVSAWDGVLAAYADAVANAEGIGTAAEPDGAATTDAPQPPPAHQPEES